MMAGGITNIEINFAGSGYNTGDTGFILGGNGDAQYIVSDASIYPDHRVSVLALVNISTGAGSGYSIAFEQGTTRGGSQPGSGNGLIVDILSVAACCDATHGPLLAIYIDSLGAGGYTSSDVITLTQGGNATGTFRIIFSGGDPIGLAVIAPGDCYSVGSRISTSGGSGSGLTVSITAISPCGGGASGGPRNKFYSTPA